MANTTYSHTVRVLACAECGAPMVASLIGGTFVCAYCKSTNQVAARDEHQDRAEAAKSNNISEAERHARLREQEKLGQTIPTSLRGFVGPDGDLFPGRVPEANLRWRQARATVARTPSFPDGERLFFLTVLLLPHTEPDHQRALLETAVECLPDRGHRHILRCILSRLAARSGDLQGAADWLEPCDQRPVDLEMDTAFRYAGATLALAGGKPEVVLTLLGRYTGDVPLSARDQLGCTLLRVEALFRTGDRHQAAKQLQRARYGAGAGAVDRAIARKAPMPLCRGPMALLRARQIETQVGRLTRQLHSKPGIGILIAVAAVPFLLAFATFVVGFMVAPRDMGPHLPTRIQRFVCAETCADCLPPIRSTPRYILGRTVAYCDDPGRTMTARDRPGVWHERRPAMTARIVHENRVRTWVALGIGIAAFFGFAMLTLLAVLVDALLRPGRFRTRAAELRRVQQTLAAQLAIVEHASR